MKIKLSAVALLALASTAAAHVTVDFADKPLPPNSNVHDRPTVSNGVTFSNSYYAPWDSWSGFAISNVNAPTTPGYGNQYAAITGTDVSGGGTYAVAYGSGSIDLPAGERPASVRLTNTAYAGLSMRDGDAFAKKFGGATGNDPDYFTVTLTGYASPAASGATTGAATFYLADFRPADNSADYIVTDWATLDLTPLGDARSIRFSLASSDVGQFGMNTPAYFALDNLVLVPEPTSLAAVVGLAIVSLRRRRGSFGR
ncbi:MAG: putative aggregation factor core protein MAFp3, isoform [Marmoricola sp.]|nr:putative aggregation factor core protein MAFp3, isoform [Marmoricola sp.]